MEDYKYAVVNEAGEEIAREMTLDHALIFIRGYFETYYAEKHMELSVRRTYEDNPMDTYEDNPRYTYTKEEVHRDYEQAKN